jgi:hypothetical protein
MNQQQYNDNVERITANCGESILEILDELKNYIADARNGDYSVETRKCAIACIDEKLYNIIKKFIHSKQKPKVDEFEKMI